MSDWVVTRPLQRNEFVTSMLLSAFVTRKTLRFTSRHWCTCLFFGRLDWSRYIDEEDGNKQVRRSAIVSLGLTSFMDSPDAGWRTMYCEHDWGWTVGRSAKFLVDRDCIQSCDPISVCSSSWLRMYSWFRRLRLLWVTQLVSKVPKIYQELLKIFHLLITSRRILNLPIYWKWWTFLQKFKQPTSAVGRVKTAYKQATQD